jgi:hypothetical protein
VTPEQLPARDDPPRMERTRLRLTIEVDNTDDPIAGYLIGADGAFVPFSGWLGLASGLEGMLVPSRSAETAPAADEAAPP